MALTKVINDLADLNQSGTTNALKGCAGTTAQQPASSSTVEYLMVAGGGGGGGWGQAGGGGAGGYVTGSTTVYHGSPTVITIGEGGAGGYSNSAVNSIDVVGLNGDDSGFNGLRAIGGGGGGSYNDPGNSVTITYAVDGGSGGGAGTQGQNNNQFSGEYGEGITGQGHDGGTTYNASGGGYVSPWMGGGGGGAGAPGSGGLNAGTGSGNGGVGIQIDDPSGINMISSANAVLAGVGENASGIWVSGGGGGGAYDNVASSGGKGGASGTAGGNVTGFGYDGTDGMVNTGAGGSGASGYSNVYGGSPGSIGIYYRGGAGGSGLGILKYNNTEVTGYTLNSEDTYTVNWPADKYGVAYWPLNLDVKDVGGNYDGTATDITYTNGQFNQAASFNGSSSYITLPNSVEIYKNTGEFAVSAWFRTNTIPTGTSDEQFIVSFYQTAYLDIRLKASGILQGKVAESSGTDREVPSPSGTIVVGTWYHVVWTGTTNDLKLYINGTLSGSSSTWNGTFFSSSAGCSIGSKNAGNDDWWNGEIEQVRLYTSMMSLTDVQDIYNNSKPGSLPSLKTSSDLTTESLSFPSGATTTALWDFNGDSVADPTTYNGVDTSMTYTAGKFGECAEFNGSSSKIDVGSGLNNSTFTVSVWFKTSYSGGTQTLINNGGQNSGETGYYLGILSSGYYRFGTSASGSGSITVDGTAALNDDTWHHIAVSYTAIGIGTSTYNIYVDGVEVSSGSNGTFTGTATRPTWIGQFSYTPSAIEYWNGKIDQIRFYTSALSSQQIYDLWQKENDIQTHFSSTDPADTTPANTDILVFKEGSGEITFKNDSPPGAEVGMLRYNSTLGQMEHFNSGGWKDFTNNTPSTLATLDYPAGKGAMALYQLQTNTNDISTNYNATNVGSNIIFGGAGKWNATGSAYFNGSSSVATMANSSTAFNLQEFTYSIWINPSSLQSGCLFGNYNYSHQGYVISLQSSGVIEYYWTCVSCPGGSPTNNLQSSGTISLNEWTHVCCTFSSTTGDKRIYINGVLDNSVNLGAGYTMQFGSVTNTSFGQLRSHDTVTYYYHGLFQQIRIYNTALSATDVNLLYNES